MLVTFVRLLAAQLVPSLLAVARPAAAFAVVQLAVCYAASFDYVSVSPAFAWLVSPPAVVFGVGFALLELAAAHDKDVARIAHDLHLDRLAGGMSSFTAGLLFSSLGLPEAEAAGLAPPPTGEGADFALALHDIAAADRPLGESVVVIGAGVGLNLLLVAVRRRLMRVLHDLDLAHLWARIETGGLVGGTIVLVFLPGLVLAMLLAASLAGIVTSFAVVRAERWMEESPRRACTTPGCTHRVRPEASWCPRCKQHCTPIPGALEAFGRSARGGLGRLRAAMQARGSAASPFP